MLRRKMATSNRCMAAMKRRGGGKMASLSDVKSKHP